MTDTMTAIIAIFTTCYVFYLAVVFAMLVSDDFDTKKEFLLSLIPLYLFVKWIVKAYNKLD